MTMQLATEHFQMMIDGSSVESADGRRFDRTSPAHDVVIGTYPEATTADVDGAVAAARRAFDHGPWPRLAGTERARVLRGVAGAIENNLEHLALIEVLESGKAVSQARDEMSGVAELWWYAATLAQHAFGDSHNALGHEYLGLTLREPVGVVAMITPWNFPLLIASQKLPFALAVGCTAVVKPSQLTPGTTLRLAEMCRDAGMPSGVVNVVSGTGSIGSHLSAHPDTDMVSFTGSTQVGRLVFAAASATLKKVSLELGGKNAMVVMADADLEAAADAAVFGVYFNVGQCCNSSSRLIVHEAVLDEFETRVIDLTKRLTVGDPLDPLTKVGAIVSDEQLATIERLVDEGVAGGATKSLGGARITTEVGRFYEPTVFSSVTPSMSIANEEIFGPVMSILKFATNDEAVALANATPYGLSAGVWTRNVDAAVTFAKRAHAGTVWVNCWMDGFPELSFGGAKQSGVGRELGRHAIEEFTELKTVTVRTGPRRMWVPS